LSAYPGRAHFAHVRLGQNVVVHIDQTGHRVSLRSLPPSG
jgi:hypothetical protein